MCNKKTFEKIFSRAYSALAHEDVSTISTVLFSWPSAVAMGGSVIAVPGKNILEIVETSSCASALYARLKIF
ncbi:hypothetical protein CHLRE_02g145902v5 [Chlamydomonas reinhardtii]|uniref:Uncharacterized protein n=1 Tax=Chlamydomonas reinhardtii TaxID=3055 RepID=A0A2K3E3S6_CHLRE|nr:uncharacterized protein CHLRE_02g145902v5 [Chlamydomonas reinhardtii]PNW87426.1 hypothetical protein CHLRE_02g145902v5 [Chlamydomonas reinhardtii]